MNRSKILDFMKAIGIILVVLGHCNFYPFLNRFIYLFHLPLFFLISGYLYHEKDSNEPWLFIGKKLQRFLPLYICYASFFVLFHNVFVSMGILDSTLLIYPIGKIVTGILDSFLFHTVEPYAAAMWFIPVLFVSLVVYNFITYLVRNVQNNKEKEIKRTFIIFLFTLLGLYLNYRNFNIGHHYQTVFVVLPFLHTGQLIQLYFKEKLKPNILLSFIFLVIAILCLIYIEGGVELSQNQTWNPVLFYSLSHMLIYTVYTFCYYISHWLPKVTRLFVYIGKNTFPIMCLHILCFKIFDFFWIHFVTKDYGRLFYFTVSYYDLWYLYIFFGVVLPLVGVFVSNWIKSYFILKYNKR